MSNTWFTSDQHYFHKNIIRYCNRPFVSVEEMNEALIKNHNDCVKQSDHVYYLGDFGFARIEFLEDVLRQLNGIKHIIFGNHCKNIKNYRQRLVNNSSLRISEMDKVIERNINGEHLYMHHYAQRVWNKSHHGAWNLFGHSHGSLPPLGKSVDVGVDSPWITGKREYRPFSFDEIKQFMDKQVQSKEDYHE